MLQPALPIQTALIGYGFSGSTFHAPLIRAEPALQLAVVVSSRPEKVPHPLQVTPQPDDVFRSSAIELVVIATPNTSHFSLARAALLAGKHVVVDKPLTTTSAEARELAALASEQNRILSTFHNRRWDADFLTVRQLLSVGTLGDVVQLESRYDRYRPEVRQRWREQPGPGSGVWWDLGPHLVDQALQLFGLPDGIFADFDAQRAGGSTTDYFHILLRYPRCRVILHGSSLARAETPRFLVQGTKGSFVKFGLDTQEDDLKRGQEPGGAVWGIDPRDGILTLGSSAPFKCIPGNYREFYRLVAASIKSNLANPVPAHEVIPVIDVLEQAGESDRRKQEISKKDFLK